MVSILHGLFGWSLRDPCFANSSAMLFPFMSEWPGTHCSDILMSEEVSISWMDVLLKSYPIYKSVVFYGNFLIWKYKYFVLPTLDQFESFVEPKSFWILFKLSLKKNIFLSEFLFELNLKKNIFLSEFLFKLNLKKNIFPSKFLLKLNQKKNIFISKFLMMNKI